MATSIEYLDYPDNLKSMAGKPRATQIGYVTISPEETLKELLPSYHVVEIWDINIPSRSKFINKNQGLRISYIPNGIGFNGTIGMMTRNNLFQSCKHPPFSDTEQIAIVERMKLGLVPSSRSQEPLKDKEAEKYVLIWGLLGYQTSTDKVIKLSTHEDYGKPIFNCPQRPPRPVYM